MSLVDRVGDNPTIPENLEKIKKSKSIFWKIRIFFVIIVLIIAVFILGTAFYAQSHSIYVDNPT
jgi:uncharacterized membrane protein YvbJ